jgi:hypothetical protein
MDRAEWLPKVGTMPDFELAEAAGVSTNVVRRARIKSGVAAWRFSTRVRQALAIIETHATWRGAAFALGMSPSTVGRLVKKNSPDRAAQQAAERSLRMAQAAAEKRGEKPPRTIEEARARAAVRKQHSKQRRAQLRNRKDTRAGTVYFIRCGDWIKIGWTGDLTRRLRAFETHCPPFEVLGVIEHQTTFTEGELHRRFASIRCDRGSGREWFRADLELLSHIKTISRPLCVEHVTGTPVCN